ncbi:hypothetical protein LPJ66_004159 [Kickxella alabastrina]|uniref:Uncharacterized protein n=1 Tax=Kickxella alabastrina TaxID=61397 RepID=A0ACC1IJG4_9FUNG|nr:hypothetical protein LPJ66_004159 [Kickxella alabastrina]
MSPIPFNRPRILVLLIALGIIATSLIVTSDHHNYWGALEGWSPPETPHHSPHYPHRQPVEDQMLLDRLAVILPINNNTDLKFYRNTWFGDYLYPVCDWEEPGCKIVCNKTSTYRTLDEKTICFSRAIKSYDNMEFFIKVDDDSFVDKGYVLDLMRNSTGSDHPVYISHHTRLGDKGNPDTLNRVLYGNGKFYMFNRNLVKCLDTEFKYHGPRNEDFVFGGMVNSGCGEQNVYYIREDDKFIWHKRYTYKNKDINLGYIKNH